MSAYFEGMPLASAILGVTFFVGRFYLTFPAIYSNLCTMFFFDGKPMFRGHRQEKRKHLEPFLKGILITRGAYHASVRRLMSVVQTGFTLYTLHVPRVMGMP